MVCEYYRPLQLEAGAAEFSEHSIADAGSVYARVHATEADPFLGRVVGAYTLPEHPGVVRITVQHHRVHRLLGDAAARGPLRAPALVRMMQPSCLGEYDPFEQVPVPPPAAAAAGAGRDGSSTPPLPPGSSLEAGLRALWAQQLGDAATDQLLEAAVSAFQDAHPELWQYCADTDGPSVDDLSAGMRSAALQVLRLVQLEQQQDPQRATRGQRRRLLLQQQQQPQRRRQQQQQQPDPQPARPPSPGGGQRRAVRVRRRQQPRPQRQRRFSPAVSVEGSPSAASESDTEADGSERSGAAALALEDSSEDSPWLQQWMGELGLDDSDGEPSEDGEVSWGRGGRVRRVPGQWWVA